MDFFERYLDIGGRGDGSMEVLFLVVLVMIGLVTMSYFFATQSKRRISRRGIGGLHKPGQRQLRHIGHIGIGEAMAHSQHRTAPFQKNRTALDRHSVRSGHDDFQLGVSQTNHARHNSPR